MSGFETGGQTLSDREFEAAQGPANPPQPSQALSAPAISEPFSLYLDVLRFGAALVVALSHIWPMLFPSHPLPWPGHSAVVVFFVLSGFVVAHATTGGRSASVYAQNRLARLWSVSLAALALCAVASTLVPREVYFYASRPLDVATPLWLPLLLNATFMAQSWGLDVEPPYDSPFWSLSFEAWYYVLFGIWTYVAPRRRLLWLAAGALIAGPRILLLMPVWLMGVLIYRARIRLSVHIAAVLFLASIVAGAAFFWFDVSVRIREAMSLVLPDFMASLHKSDQFVGDMLLGLIVSLNFVAAANLDSWLGILERVKGLCRTAASFTFSIYLYHVPLFSLLWGFFGLRSALTVAPALALGIVALGLVTERQLPLWRGWAAKTAFLIGGSKRRPLQGEA